MRYRTYTLRIEGPESDNAGLSNVGGALNDAEDIINAALPDGFYCKIDDSGEGVDMAAVENLERFAAENEGDGREPDGTRLSNNLTIQTDR